MANYKSKPHTLAVSAQTAYDRLSNPSNFGAGIRQLPEEVRQKMPPIEFTDDSLTLETPQVGKLTFKIVERTPGERIRFAAQGSPIPLEMALEFADGDPATVTAAIIAEIPAMLRPLVGGKLQEASNKLAETIANVLR